MSPLPYFETDLYCQIYATSLTSSAFPWPPSTIRWWHNIWNPPNSKKISWIPFWMLSEINLTVREIQPNVSDCQSPCRSRQQRGFIPKFSPSLLFKLWRQERCPLSSLHRLADSRGTEYALHLFRIMEIGPSPDAQYWFEPWKIIKLSTDKKSVELIRGSIVTCSLHRWLNDENKKGYLPPVSLYSNYYTVYYDRPEVSMDK